MSPRPPSSPSPAASSTSDSNSNSNSNSKPAPIPPRFQPQYQQTPVGNDGKDDGKLKKAVKWVVGYESNAPSTISSGDYLREAGENPKEKITAYVSSLFPFLRWITRYNTSWLIGDLIAGITVGMVLVPQSMSYARLANLRPEFGLYSSFVGVFVYAFFATSKDVSIGPVAVMSLQTGRIIDDVMSSHPGQWPAEVIATQLAFICGFIVLGVGLLRIGWLVEFIPVPAVAGFMTGSAINIAAGQVPAIFGIANRLDTKAATYKVVINTLKNLKHAKLDAAIGVPCLVGLYAMKWTCAHVERRYPKYRRAAFFISVLRNAVMIIIFTIAAWRITERTPGAISVLKTVPSGFQHVGTPVVSSELISAMAGKLPVATIILLLEHIAIAKSFGRLNNYKIDPNQELIAIGVSNLLGTLFNAYPATGSFSRSALKSKSGVRTPAAGWPTGVCVIVALYALTGAFYYIPNAALSAIIIHAVADLVVSPRGAYSFWKVSPFEFFIWLAAVLVTVFSSIENGIYTSLIASLVLLLFRIARPGGHFLGRVRVGVERPSSAEQGLSSDASVPVREFRDVYVPFNTNQNGMTNPAVKIEPPPDGVIIYRFEESFIYPNASYHNSALVDYVKANTKRGKEASATKLGDRPWNDPGPSRFSLRRGKKSEAAQQLENEANGVVREEKMTLRAVILDFGAVANLDTTGVQNLVDTRKEIERWADAPISFHFSGIISPWVSRALVAGGFGTSDRPLNIPVMAATVVPQDIRNIRCINNEPNPDDASSSAGADLQRELTRRSQREIQLHRKQQQQQQRDQEEVAAEAERARGRKDRKGTGEEGTEEYRLRTLSQSSSVESLTDLQPLVSLSTPYFHFDLAEAVRAAAAEAALERTDSFKPPVFTAGH